VGLRRPPTSRAHRLRKPDRTSELLAPSVTRWPREHGLRPGASSTVPGPRGSLAGGRGRTPSPSRQICRCRRRFRTTATSKTGAPSIGSSQTLRPGRVRCACCSLAQVTPHPVARCEPGAASSRAAWSPRAIPRLCEPPRGGLLRRRERCASPTSATDFVHEHPADCCVSGCASTPLPALRRLATLRAPTHPGPLAERHRDPGATSLSAFPVSMPDGASA
jgi:hypothetical protein